ncbi:BPSL0067 family protein [Massilia sp. DWR3-1-1]|uniref:BPSL0067 family protein n=1 Tax=Massilia sp. DWR3-1-1 TaxID=2804559 RepID=UPI003CEFBD3D
MSLAKQPKVGDGECVALVREFSGAPAAVNWREGTQVMGDRSLHLGTAIATFQKGKWPGKSKGNHAAFYLGQTSDGMRIMDQWNAAEKTVISSRFIPRRGKNKDGSFVRPSDNADAFSVIE